VVIGETHPETREGFLRIAESGPLPSFADREAKLTGFKSDIKGITFDLSGKKHQL
jgi:hypothetical protein